VDSQSLRAAANIPRSTSGWDGGKKVGGRKRHLVVDCLGLVLTVAVTAASVQGRDAAVPLLQRLRDLHFSIRLVWADGGYAGSLVDWARENFRLTLEVTTSGWATTAARWSTSRPWRASRLFLCRPLCLIAVRNGARRGNWRIPHALPLTAGDRGSSTAWFAGPG